MITYKQACDRGAIILDDEWSVMERYTMLEGHVNNRKGEIEALVDLRVRVIVDCKKLEEVEERYVNPQIVCQENENFRTG